MIKLVIVDDHRLFNQGIASLLSDYSNFKLVGQFEDAESFLKELTSLRPDIVLMDIDLPGINGIQAITKAKQNLPGIKTIILSFHDNISTIQECLKLGVDGYLLKTSGHYEMIRAITSVYNGNEYFTDEIKSLLVKSFRSEKSYEDIVLTPREKEILALICDENTSLQIAEKLCISPNTVETHRKNLLSKTGCKSGIGLARFAIDNGLV